MSNKKILCLGNNTEDTDIRAKLVAREQNLEYHGLVVIFHYILYCAILLKMVNMQIFILVNN
jgi:hypothetical protein